MVGREPCVAGRAPSGGEPQDRGGKLCRASEQRRSPRRRRRVQQRLEELARHAVGEVALELAAASDEDGPSRGRGDAARGLEQRALADSRLSLDEQDLAVAGAGRIH
jgi:hypothetical protein